MNTNMNEIDHILASEQQITPSLGFAQRVMAAVRREAATPAPIAFPWRRVLPGIAGIAVLTLAGALLLAASLPAEQGVPSKEEWDIAGAMSWAVGSLAACYLVVRMALRRAGEWG